MYFRSTLLVVAIATFGCGETSSPSPKSGNPCENNNGGCDPNAICEPIDGLSVCSCKTGYVGDGITCAPDPCTINNGGCAPNATCALADGKPVCTCNSGFVGDGTTCAPEDPCAFDNGGCDANATCALVNGEPVCTCKHGYEGDGLTCTRLDPCTVDNGGCDVNAICELIDDEPSCTCKEGYTGDGTYCAVDPEFLPRLAVVSPGEGNTFSLAQPATVTVNGTVYDSDLAALEYRIDEGTWNVVTVDGGTFTFLFDLQDEDHTSHIISIVATDLAGHTSEVNRTIVVDRLAPRLVVSSPQDGEVLMETSYLVTGTVNEADLQQLTMRLDDGAETALVLAGSSFEEELLLPEESSAIHRITVTAIDGLGNTASSEVTFALGPRITFSGLEEGQVFNSDAPNPVLVSGRIDNASTASYSLDGAAPLPVSLGAFSIPVALNDSDDRVQHVLSIEATNANGHSASRSVSFLVDRVAPVVSIRDLSNGQILGGSVPNPFIATGIVAEAAIASVTYSIDSAPPVTLAPTSTLEIPIPLDETDDHVSHTLVVEAVDAAGNATTETRLFIVDRMAPAISIAGLADQQVLNAGAPNPFSVTLEVSEAALVSSTYRIDSSVPVSFPGPTGAASIPLVETDDLQPHTFVVEATDSAGNFASTSLTFFVDRVAPRIALGNLVEQQLLGLAAPNPYPVTGTFIEASLHSAQFRIDSGTPTTLPTASPSFSLNLPLDDDDDFVSHTLLLEATDSAGNSAERTIAYLVDRVAPRVAITTPSQDGSCEAGAATCSGAVINRATASPFRFAGTVHDAGLPETGGLSATVNSVHLSPSGSTQWTCDWTNLPNSNGASYTFTLTATDKAGNAASASRVVWVDRVAPQLLSSVNNGRLVPRDATLATFSEPMNVASVRSATTFSPSAIASKLAASDQRSFAFSSIDALSPYTVYSMQIAQSAFDRAGNALTASSTVLFLTEPVDPDLSSTEIALNAADPVLRTDPDGRPVLIYRSLSGTSVQSKFWLGTSTNNSSGWENKSLTMPSGTLKALPSDLAVSGTLQADLRLAPTYKAVIKVTTASDNNVYFAERQPASNWALSQRLGLTSEVGRPSLASGLIGGTTKEFIPYLDTLALEVLGSVRNGSSWAAVPALLELNQPALAMNQAGALAFDGLAYLPDRVFLPRNVDETKGGLAVAGIQQLEIDGSPVGSAYLAYSATSTMVLGSFSYTKPFLAIACSSTPASPSSWKEGTNTPPILPFGCGSLCNSPKRITGLSMAVSETKVAIAVEVDGNTVYFGSMDNGDCTAAPSNVTWETGITSAKQPAVAVGRNGKIYKAYVAETSDTLRWAP
ncbi:MAG: EGF domain-containing protein [Myxococcales bacterium]|jgi:hypothetical protein